MATVRYIGPSVVVDGVEHGRVRVPQLDREMDPDEVVEIPDELVERYAWPETLWDVSGPSKASKSSKASKPSTGNGE